jgi:hypothetical protein
MTDTYEVTVHPKLVATLVEMHKWCDENTNEFGHSISLSTDDAGLILADGGGDDCAIVVAARREGYVEVLKYLNEVQFYFFNDLDAMHFKLRWCEYL